jgi:hypothetical protein
MYTRFIALIAVPLAASSKNSLILALSCTSHVSISRPSPSKIYASQHALVVFMLDHLRSFGIAENGK